MAIIGTNAGDVLTGTGVAEVVDSGDGSDVIEGLGGDDTIDAGDGFDFVLGNAGGDSIDGGDGADILIGADLILDMTAETLRDAFSVHIPGGQFLFLGSSIFPLVVADDGAADTLFGGDGNDYILASLGDTAIGEDGTDMLMANFASRGSALNIDLRTNANVAIAAALGGAVSGFESFIIYGTAFADIIHSDLEGGMIFGGVGSDTIHAHGFFTGIDTGTLMYDPETGISADDGVADTVFGGDGEDTVTIGILDSADGADNVDRLTINFQARGSALNVTVANGTENAAWSAAVGGTITNFEEFSVIGTAFGDTITLAGALTLNVDGAGGDDIIQLGDSSDTAQARGGAGNDRITGGAGLGQTNMQGEGGDDILTAGAAFGSLLFGGAGADVLTGGSGIDHLDHGIGGGADPVSFLDDGAADTLSAGGGNDTAWIGMGDSADGGAGSDGLMVFFLAAGSGRNVDLRTTPDASLSAAVGGTITGWETYSLIGSNFADTFIAGATDARFFGGDGVDTLTGGNGQDELHGGFYLGSTDYGLTELNAWDYRDFQDDFDADVIVAGGGNDEVFVALGDSADGGTGTGDILRVFLMGSASGVNLNMSGGESAALSTALGATIANFEEIHVAGSMHNDVITGGVNTLAIHGLAGNDTITIGTAGILGILAFNYITSGGTGADTIAGTANANVIATGEAGEFGFVIDFEAPYRGHLDLDIDTVSAGGGADKIFAGMSDNIDGGAGTDILYLLLGGATSGVTINMTGGANAGVSAGMGSTVQNIEQFQILGSIFNDTIVGDASLLLVEGREGDDTLSLVSGSAFGGDGADILSALGATAVTFSGGDGADTLTGLGGSDSLLGDDGDDAVSAGGGSDSVGGGDGNDILSGGDGNDSISGDDGNDLITGGAGDDILQGGRGADSISGGAGSDSAFFLRNIADYQIAESNGVVTVTGVDGITTLSSVETIHFADADYLPTGAAGGTAGNDVLEGTSGNDTLSGLGGNDILSGLAGDDTLSGGNGVDTASYVDATSAVTVDLAILTNQNTGGAGIDRLISIEGVTGSDHNDTLTGNGSANTLSGGLGNDVLNGAGGNDVIFDTAGVSGVAAINAGSGDDLIVLSGAFHSGVVNGSLGTDQVTANGVISGLTFQSVETLNTGGGVVTATATQLRLFSTIQRSASETGAEIRLVLSTGGVLNLTNKAFGRDVNVVGASGGDVITGSNGDDNIDGGAGGDTLNGGDGNDTLTGGDGPDRLDGGEGNDTLSGGTGNDTLLGGAGDDDVSDTGGAIAAITAGLGDDIITLGTTLTSGTVNGGGGADEVNVSGFLRDVVYTGVETLNTGGGLVTATAAQMEAFDTIRVSSANTNGAVSLRLSAAGTINLAGELGTRTVTFTGSTGNDVITTGDGADTIAGGAGNDSITARSGNDLILQSSTDGRDIIDGGIGADTYRLTGVAAAETFRIYTRAEAIAAGMTGLAAGTEIVITRDGTTSAAIIAELDNIEEIEINSLVSTANNGNGVVDGGAAGGDTIMVIGDFTTTSLAYSTIHIEGSSAADTVDITGLRSAHRVVFTSNGGADSVIGAPRPQDVFTGVVPAFGASDGLDVLARSSIRDLRQADFDLGRGQTLRTELGGPAQDSHAMNDVMFGNDLDALFSGLGRTMVETAGDLAPLDFTTHASGAPHAAPVFAAIELSGFGQRYILSDYDILPA